MARWIEKWNPEDEQFWEAEGKKVARRIEAGMVFVNYPFISAPELPFGGIKRSGYGKDLSVYALEDYSVVRHIMVKL